MQTKTIDKVISKKISQWLASITDIDLRNSIEKNIVVTGGCITSMLLKEKPNDYDIYFRDAKLCLRVAEYYSRQMGGDALPLLADRFGNFSTTKEYDLTCKEKYVHTYIPSSGYISERGLTEDKEVDDILETEQTPAEKANATTEGRAYRPVFITSNAITLSNQIQLITRFCGDPEVIHKNFDMQHTKMYWTKADGVVTNTASLECVLSKRLIYSGSKFPLCSIIRVRKFIQRGWSIDAGQLVKMTIQLNGLDLLEPKTLVQQLIGVDTTYFAWLLDELTKPEHLTDEGKIDQNHAMNLINYMFDSVDE